MLIVVYEMLNLVEPISFLDMLDLLVSLLTTKKKATLHVPRGSYKPTTCSFG
jgi:hypothetical protein